MKCHFATAATGLKILLTVAIDMQDKKKQKAEFRVLKNGPLQVSGDFILKCIGGREMETRDMIFLCRCGGSANKPFCDGSHRRVGLKD
jgi:hypothetical protein